MRMYVWEDVGVLSNEHGGCVIVLAIDSKQAVDLAVEKHAKKWVGASDENRRTSWNSPEALRRELETNPPEEISFPYAFLSNS